MMPVCIHLSCIDLWYPAWLSPRSSPTLVDPDGHLIPAGICFLAIVSAGDCEYNGVEICNRASGWGNRRVEQRGYLRVS